MRYDGPALIGETPVRLRLTGRWEPVDGRYHWGGRVDPEPRIAQLVRAGRREVRVVIGDRSAPARLAEVDPWGGVRITGVGAPPWPAEGDEHTAWDADEFVQRRPDRPRPTLMPRNN